MYLAATLWLVSDGARLQAQTSGVLFVEQTNPFPSLISGSLSWADFNNDGNLDLLLTGGTGSPTGPVSVTSLFLNHCSIFTNSGIALPPYRSSCAECGDFDNDGFVDLAIAGLSDYDEEGARIYRNLGGTNLVLFAFIPGVFGKVVWGDFNQDGFLDLAAVGERSIGGAQYSRVFINQHGTGFIEANLLSPELWGWDAGWADYDRDGNLDLFVAGMPDDYHYGRTPW